MNFAELRFWGLLFTGLASVLLARLLVSKSAPAHLSRFDKLALLALGLFLLVCVSWVTFVIFLVVAIGSYLGLVWIMRHHSRHAKKYLWVLIPLQLLPLAYYKYGDFIVNQTLGFDVSVLRNIIIPVGISFYTFQKVAFVVDTLAFKQPLPKFLDYLNFAGFFPQIVAGPIERRSDLLPQMEDFRFRWLPAGVDEGAGWIALGFFFKCGLADNLATYFDGSSRNNPYLIWLANTVFGLRIYYDFAGYSLIALGLARCLGIRLTLNFASPYCSTSVTEFWRRWHVTLSQWFRDYLYIPLGGNRTRAWALALTLVFIVSGIWHGAGWNFILWGLFHALFLIVNRQLRSRVTIPALGWLFTMAASFSAWLCFYERSTPVLLSKLKTLIDPTAYHSAALLETIHHWTTGDAIVLLGLLLLAAATLILEWLSLRRTSQAYYYLRRPAVLFCLVILTVWLAPGRNNGFIYFAF